MSTDPKKIELTDEDRQLLARAAKQSGKPWRALLREMLSGIMQQGAVEDRADVCARQKRALRDLWHRLDGLPTSVSDDGLSNRDHDHILYGGK